jgi:hypothetical protein
LYVPRALDFSAFPSLLLLTTLFRLAINVSVTRLVLLHGDGQYAPEFLPDMVAQARTEGRRAGLIIVSSAAAFAPASEIFGVYDAVFHEGVSSARLLAASLDVASRSLLIDCGPATTYKLTRAGRRTPEISLLLFTHHHFDHSGGLRTYAADARPFLIDTGYDPSVASDPAPGVAGHVRGHS